RGVARFHDVHRDVGVGQVEPFGDAFDDAGVGLVRDEGGDLVRAYSGAFARLQGERRERGGGPAEHLLALLLHVRPPALDAYRVAALGSRAPQDGPDAGLLALLGGAHDGRTGAVAEQDAGSPVGPVGEVGQLLGAHHDGVARRARPDGVVDGTQRVGEAGARGVEVVRGRRV